jgi:hypothetical protein
MHRQGTRDNHHSSSACASLGIFDENKLGRDVLFAISRVFGHGEQFVGHDGRQYVIIAKNEQSESESFVDVLVKLDGEQKVVAKYAIVPQRISP